jgi:hypothetical protein
MWRSIRAVVGGAASAWLFVLGFLVLLALRPDVGPLSLRGVAEAVAALGWLPGIAIAVLTPVAALVAWALNRFPGGGLIACGLVGAVAGLAVYQLIGGNMAPVTVVPVALGAASGVVGWLASPWASRSSARTVTLVLAAGGVWTTALLVLMHVEP